MENECEKIDVCFTGKLAGLNGAFQGKVTQKWSVEEQTRLAARMIEWNRGKEVSRNHKCNKSKSNFRRMSPSGALVDVKNHLRSSKVI